MTDFTSYENIKINNQSIRRPDEFSPEQESIFAGEYETCSGDRVMDYVGWRWSDVTLTWEGLDASSVATLASMTVPSTIQFDAPSKTTGEPELQTERVIRTSAVQALHPYKQNGVSYYRRVSVSIRFLDAHREVS